MTALTVDTSIAPPPVKADVPTPGQLAADNALRRAHESVVTDGALHFVDPDAGDADDRFYRASPEPGLAPNE